MPPDAPMVGLANATGFVIDVITFETRNPAAPATLKSTNARAGPYTSVAAGPRLRIHIMLNRM